MEGIFFIFGKFSEKILRRKMDQKKMKILKLVV